MDWEKEIEKEEAAADRSNVGFEKSKSNRWSELSKLLQVEIESPHLYPSE